MLSTTDSDWPEVVGTPAWSAALRVVFIPNTISDSPNTWQIQNQASFLWVSILLVIMEALLSTVATNVSVCGLRLDGGGGRWWPDATAPQSFPIYSWYSPACGLRRLGQSRCRWPTLQQLKHCLGVWLSHFGYGQQLVPSVQKCAS